MNHLMLAAIVGLSPAAPPPAWVRYTAVLPCVPFATCASVTLQSFQTPTTSVISITIRNPHNLSGNLIGPFVFNTRRCEDPTQTMFDGCPIVYGPAIEVVERGVGIRTDGAVRKVGTELWFPDIYENIGLQYTHEGGDFYGCDMNLPFDPDEPWSAYYSVCPKEGFGGAITLLFYFDGQLKLPDFTYVDMASPGIQFQGGEGHSALCTPRVPCTYSVAPEPRTWLMLASGLVGLGAFGWRQRRRRREAHPRPIRPAR